jgi:hypothetical protein
MYFFSGESTVSFLYTRDRFGWDIRKYTQFGSAVTVVSLIGKYIRKVLAINKNHINKLRGNKFTSEQQESDFYVL